MINLVRIERGQLFTSSRDESHNPSTYTLDINGIQPETTLLLDNYRKNSHTAREALQMATVRLLYL